MDIIYLENIFEQRSHPTSIIRDVELELKRLKENLQDLSEDKKLNLRPMLAENERLSDQCTILKSRASRIAFSADDDIKNQLKECSVEIAQITESFEGNRLILSALSDIIVIHHSVAAAESYLKSKLFRECSLSLQEGIKKSNLSQELRNLLMYKTIVQEITTVREQLLFDMSKVWQQGVHFSHEETDDGKLNTIKIDNSSLTELKEIVVASSSLNNEEIIKNLFRKFKEDFLLPVIMNESLVSVQNHDASCILTVIVKKNKAINYMKVFEDIIAVLSFFKAHLNVEIDGRGDLISYLGRDVANDVTSTLVKHCLSEAIPSQPGQSETFPKIVCNAEKFQESLQMLGFLNCNSESIFVGGDGGSDLFANKMYLSYLDRARNIMKKDLHNSVKCQPLTAPDWHSIPLPVFDSIKQTFNIKENQHILIDSHLISKSALEVLELAEAILDDMKKRAHGDGAIKQLYTVRNIFEIYSAVVPVHHKKLLSSLPQHVALFHNNCLYFAFYLLSLGCECRTWSGDVRDHYYIFIDQGAALRQLAVETLESCVSNQRNNIIAILCDSGLGGLQKGPELDADTERSVRQCIRQLQLLRNVWSDVLPSHVLANSLGFLIDQIIETVVTMVTGAEDLSAAAASQLIMILGVMEKRLLELFQEPKEVYRICRKWDRFKELVFILDNNLDKISERWAFGKGPLAHSFTKSEAQGLIRALFKNTERRAVVLSQIYNS